MDLYAVLRTLKKRLAGGSRSGEATISRPDNFELFTYSRNSHCLLFSQSGLERALYGERLALENWNLKRYQDLLVLSFINSSVPEGSRLLEVGGGKSRIIRHLYRRYECWNVDKLEGCGRGPTDVDAHGFRLVRAYIGDFSSELPNDHFDFVFSISALEHVPQRDPSLFTKIHQDLNRVLKPGGYSLHCLDVRLCRECIIMNELLPYLFTHEETCNSLVSFERVSRDCDLFVVSEPVYNQSWLPIVRHPYSKFGKPFSHNILWRKR